MVAIVSGNTLGLNLTSKGVLGGQGISGNAATGQGGEQVYVNASTGNLVMQQLQDELVGAGLDVASVLTYNSLGLANDDNGDNFSIGKAPVQLVLSGAAVNTAGSLLTRTAFDGSRAVYTWDAPNSRYVAVNGTGAFDTITFSAAKYTWVDGATQAKETYDGSTGNLLTRVDAAGNTVTFGYTGALLTSVTDANGETVTYVYSGNLLQQIKAPVTTWVNGVATTSVQPVVTYTYDGSNRLASVIVDLSPDGAVADGKVYTTSYTYDGTSKRVQTVSQSDGTKLTFAYDGSNRVYTITDALLNVTTFGYDTTNKKTSVTANGQTTVYAYGRIGELLSVAAPSVNGTSPTTQFAYNGNGEVTSAIDPDGRKSSMGYDAAGNQVRVLSAAGNLTVRQFDLQNRLVSETTSTLLAPTLISAANLTVRGGVVTKLGGVAQWDNTAYSTNAIAGPCTVRFTGGLPNTDTLVGLDSDPANHADFDYAVYLAGDGTVQAYASGHNLAYIGTHAQGDSFSVSYDGAGHVSIVQNGVIIYTMAATVTKPLSADCSIYQPGASITDLAFGPGQPINQPPVLVGTPNISISSTVVTKTGTISQWDNSAYSVSAISGPCTVSFIGGSPNTDTLVGLDSDPANHANFDYAVYLAGDGTVQAYASGHNLSYVGTHAQGDKFSVSYDGAGHVSIVQNGAIIYTMAAAVTKPLHADCAFYQPGAKVTNLTFGSSQSTDQTTRYVYSADGKGLLRYKISPDGRVTEYGYNTQGQLTSSIEYVKSTYSTAGLASNGVPSEARMNTWRATQDLTQIERTDFTRDGRQQISSTITYWSTTTAGVGVAGTSVTTTYVYDPSGRLMQVIRPGSAKTIYVYDGLGRATSTTDALGRTTTTAYADAAGTVSVTYANQLVTTSAFDKNGRLVSTTSAASGSTLSKGTVDYDALGNVLRLTDLTGVSTWYLYDADGRKVGAIDGTGALTEYVYDNASQITETIGYAARVNTALLVDGNGKPSNPSLASVRPTFNAATDQRSWVVYDAAGRISQTINATGTVTQFAYDGAGRTTSVCTFATAVNVSSFGAAPAFQFVSSAAGDRVSRNYYDGDGHLVGSLDPDNFLTVYQVDAAGQQTVTIRYATRSPAVTAQSTLAQLVPAASTSDQRTVTLYSMEGLVTGKIDALGTLTQYVYNPRHTVDHVTRYATSVGTAIAAGAAVDSIKPSASAADTTTSYVYDANDRVTSQTDPAGIVTTFTYDSATDELLSSTTASSRPEATTTQSRYDAMGRAVQELDAVGSALTVGQTPAQIDAIWAQRAVSITYDLAGRKASLKDAGGNVTLYFYDGDGQLRYTVDALNSVKEFRYDAFGHVTTTLAYATAINPAGLGGGGLITAALTSAVAAVANPAKDVVSRSVYDTAGHLVLSVDTTGAATQYTYDAEGNLTQTRQLANTAPAGTALQVNGGGGTAGMARLALGQFQVGDTITVSVDMKAPAGTYGSVYVGNDVADQSYSGNLAGTGTWQAVTLTLKVTSADAVSVRFHSNTTSAVVYDNIRVTSVNRGVVAEVGAFDQMVQSPYASNWKLATQGQWMTEGPGYATVATTLLDSGSDAQLQALVTSLVDPGRDRVSRMVYDADGRVTLSVDPVGAATQYAYDANGNLTTTRQYANAIATSNVLQVSDPTNQMNAAFALLGTFTNETVTVSVRFKGSLGQAARIYLQVGSTGVADSGWTASSANGWVTLSLTYAPPANTPSAVYLVMQTAAGATTLYDDLTVRGSSSGLVWQTSFDSMPLGTGPRQWDPSSSARVAQAESLSDASDAQLLAEAAASADPARDRVTRRLYDADGRVTLSVDPTGGATAYTYDANGKVTKQYQYANPIATSNVLQVSDPTNQMNAAFALLGTFTNETVTVSVRFKGSLGQAARIYLQVGSTGVADSGWTANSANGWVTLSLTYAPPANTPSAVYLVMQTAAGATTLYDDLTVRGSSSGLVWQTSFDSMPLGTGPRQWDPSSSAHVAQAESLSDASDAQLLAEAAASADPARDRFTSNEYDADGHLVYSADALGNATRIFYDALGRVVYTVAADGAVTHDEYDADSRVIKTTTFANKIAVAGLAHALNASDIPAIASLPSDAITQNRYDALGRLRFMMDGTGGLTELRYDADGHVVDRIAYANPATWSTSADPTVTADPMHDRHVHSSYDAFGQVLAQADATGAVVVNTYDADGHLTDRLSYANRITAGSWTSGPWPLTTPDSARDIHERFVYNALGQLSRSADGTGAVTAFAYDANGNLVQRSLLATPAAAGQAINTVGFSGLDRTERFAYDAFGRQVWHADASNALDYIGYDADGRVTKTIRYAQPLAGSLPAGTTFQAPAGADRVTKIVYNAFGQVTYARDSLNRVSLSVYDRGGYLKSQTRYAAVVAAATDPATVAVNPALDETTQYQYDAVGRLLQRTDALGGIEAYAYDGVGNKTSFTNEKVACLELQLRRCRPAPDGNDAPGRRHRRACGVERAAPERRTADRHGHVLRSHWQPARTGRGQWHAGSAYHRI